MWTGLYISETGKIYFLFFFGVRLKALKAATESTRRSVKIPEERASV